MKKHIKLFVFIATLLLVFGIYNLLKGNSEKINYIALGDSVAEGMNPYGAVGYGYPDYVKDELLKNEKLKFYTKGFSKSGYTIENVKNDIENNEIIIVDDKKVSIKQSLRESDVVTISIGANDFIRGLSLSNFSETVNNVKDSKKNIDKIANNLRELLELIQSYAKNKIIVIGYYNPLPRMKLLKSDIDELVKYSNHLYENICDDLGVIYIDIFNEFDGNEDFLPNSLDIHPSTDGYKKIAEKILEEISS